MHTKKISLNKETLRLLVDRDLKVVEGAQKIQTGSCAPECITQRLNNCGLDGGLGY